MLDNQLVDASDVMNTPSTTKAKATPKAKAKVAKADIKTIFKTDEGEAIVTEAVKAFKAKSKTFTNLEGKTLERNLALGEIASRTAHHYTSNKMYGAMLNQVYPDAEKMDTALRSNCKKLFCALNKEPCFAVGKNEETTTITDLFDILSTVDNKAKTNKLLNKSVQELSNDPIENLKLYYSQNPTVVMRDYTKAKAKLEQEAKDVDKTDEQKEAEAQAKADAQDPTIAAHGFVKAIKSTLMDAGLRVPFDIDDEFGQALFEMIGQEAQNAFELSRTKMFERYVPLGQTK